MPMFTKPNTKAKKGFTLIELLVVISIIGLLSTLAVVALNNARQRSRDAKRVADMQQLMTAFTLFFETNGNFSAGGLAVPATGAALHADAGCGSATDGMQGVLANIEGMRDPSFPAATTVTPLTSVAAFVSNAACTPAVYTAMNIAATNATTFEVRFCLESGSGSLATGLHRISEVGME